MCEPFTGGPIERVRLALPGREVACRAIIFDKDGTLVDPTGLQSRLTRVRALRAAAQAAVGPLQGAGMELGPRQRGNCPAQAESQAAAEDLGAEWPAGPDLLPGVADTLAVFQRLGLRLAVATGSERRNAEATLDALGVRERFAAVIGIDDVASGKPAPDMVFAACQRLGCSPAEVIVVGDSPADLLMGRAAGVAACIGVTGGVTASDRLGALADAVLPTVAELPGLLLPE